MLFQTKSYLKFLWNSKNEHAVHSPFVFNLLTKCFYDKKTKPEYDILSSYRKSFLQNKNTIKPADFDKNNRKQIPKIAKTAEISSKRAKLLYRVTAYLSPNTILEIGTLSGLVTSALFLGNPKAKIIPLKTFSEIRSLTKTGKEKYDFIYFEGNHSKESTLTCFELLLSTISNDTLWIFDGIYWSAEMEEAWKIIKNHPKVKVTIDTFQWGLVFFRYEQEKEHFIIRV